MKAEINNENKLKFFAHYIGQRVVGHDCDIANFQLSQLQFDDLEVGIYGDWSGGTNPEKSCLDVVSISDVWLNLKPLSSISDEDAIECLEILDIKEFVSKKDRYGWIIEAFEKNMWSHRTINSCYCDDYLRSKSYALPWMGLSVQEMVEAGWIKLV